MKSSVPSNNRVITLLTDFGYTDPFVGQMKGVILSINPHVNLIDITHDIEQHDIERAAFILWNSYKYFPSGTIHIAVVDPGVGTRRKAIVAEIENHYFLFPDNGIISYLIKNFEFRAFQIENTKYILNPKSPTFQGRDLFASAAAWLSKDEPIERFGREIKKLSKIPIREPRVFRDARRFGIIGDVIYIDRFGNAITNIKISSEKPKEIIINGKSLFLVKSYKEGKDKPSALINSDGYLEIFIYKGNVSKLLKIKKNTKVEVLLNG